MGKTLSQADIRFIQELKQKQQQRYLKLPKGTKDDDHIYQSSFTYVARAPTGGIAALSDAGTPGTADDDTPGSATCDIWRITTSGDLEIIEFTTGNSLDKTVYNTSTVPILENAWIIVGKCKNGSWVVLNPNVGFIRCKATLAETITGTASTVDVDNVTVIYGANPVTSASDILGVDNIFSWDGEDGNVCFIEYNYTSENWQLYQLACS